MAVYNKGISKFILQNCKFWTKSAKCQALMKEHGYNEEIELQGHLLRHVEQRIKGHGKRMLGWEEVKHGNKVSKDTVVYAWINEEAVIEETQDEILDEVTG